MKKAAVLVACLAVAFLVGFFQRDLFAGRAPDPSSLGRLVNRSGPIPSPVEVFQSNYDYILANYAREIDPIDLRNSAMSGLVASLGDPHTNFLDPQVASNFRTETEGDFVGIGARLQENTLGATVFTVFENSPASRAGVKSGDVITAVDGVSVADQNIDDIVSKVKGQDGSTVVLTVTRQGSPQPIDLKIVRRRVEIPTVEHRMIDGNVGYLNVSSFTRPTTTQFRQALESLKADGMQGLVIDMRGNGGGILATAVEMLSVFVEDKPVVSIRGRGGSQDATEKTTFGQKMNLGVPVAVLVDESSASATEIFAGVLQQYGFATIVGQHTYGKGSVQDVLPLPEGATAKITIAKYFLPDGSDISRKVDDNGEYISGGIVPDVPVEMKLDANTRMGEPGRDSQLDKALDVLRGKRAF